MFKKLMRQPSLVLISCLFIAFFCCRLTFPEELLDNFAQQIGAWRLCLYFLSSTRNDYVMMYSLTVFEVSCQMTFYCLEKYFVVTVPGRWRWPSASVCRRLGKSGSSAQGLPPTHCLCQGVCCSGAPFHLRPQKGETGLRQ